jgi:hypothetical protein
MSRIHPWNWDPIAKFERLFTSVKDYDVMHTGKHSYADMRVLFLRWMIEGKLNILGPNDGRDVDYFILDSFGYTPEDRSSEAIWVKVREFVFEMNGKLDWLFYDDGFTLFKAYLARHEEGLRGVDE